MLYLRLHLPNGSIWTQTHVAYSTTEEMQRVFERVGQHLPVGTEGEPILREEAEEKHASST